MSQTTIPIGASPPKLDDLQAAIQNHLNEAVTKGPMDNHYGISTGLQHLHNLLTDEIHANHSMPYPDADGFAYPQDNSTPFWRYMGNLVTYQYASMSRGLPFEITSKIQLTYKLKTATPVWKQGLITSVRLVTDHATSILAPQCTQEGPRIVETYSYTLKKETIVTKPMTMEEFLSVFPDKCTKVHVIPKQGEWRAFKKPPHWVRINRLVL